MANPFRPKEEAPPIAPDQSVERPPIIESVERVKPVVFDEPAQPVENVYIQEPERPA